jgi:hypothetical protein
MALYGLRTGRRVCLADSETEQDLVGTIVETDAKNGTVTVRWDQSKNWGETLCKIDAGNLIPVEGW